MKRLLRPIANRTLAAMLRGPFADPVEQLLLRLGRALPDACPGHGIAIDQIAARHAGSTLVARLAGGVPLCVPATSDGCGLYFRGRLLREDERLTRLLARLLRDGDVFFDVGANLGYYTCLAAPHCGPAGQVHAFEPQGRLVPYIRQSLRLNGFDEQAQARVRHAAVSAQHGGTATLFVAADAEEQTALPSLFQHEWLAGGSREAVPAVSLDGYVRDERIARVDAVKVDVEGAELQVLEGLRETLRRSPPDALIAEVLPERLRFASIEPGKALRADPAASRAAELVALLAKYGYAPRSITPDGFIGPGFTLEEMARVAIPTNVLFVRPDIATRRPAIIRQR